MPIHEYICLEAKLICDRCGCFDTLKAYMEQPEEVQLHELSKRLSRQIEDRDWLISGDKLLCQTCSKSWRGIRKDFNILQKITA